MEKLNQDFREFIGMDELLRNKQPAARAKDLIDVHALRELLGKD